MNTYSNANLPNGAIQMAVFTEDIEQAREFISYYEASEVAKVIEVPVEAVEE